MLSPLTLYRNYFKFEPLTINDYSNSVIEVPVVGAIFVNAVEGTVVVVDAIVAIVVVGGIVAFVVLGVLGSISSVSSLSHQIF